MASGADAAGTVLRSLGYLLAAIHRGMELQARPKVFHDPRADSSYPLEILGPGENGSSAALPGKVIPAG